MWNLSLLVEGSKLTTLSFPWDSMCKKKKTNNVFHCSDLPSLFSILGITDFSDFLFIHLDMDIFFLKENYFIVFMQNIFLYYKRYCSSTEE